MEQNRRNFLRNVFMAAAISLLPKILRPCEYEVVEEENNSALFNDLQLLTPHYYESYLEKYGNQNWALIHDEMYFKTPITHAT